MDVTYPDDAAGEATVLLELTIDAEGRVTAAHAVEGEAPFTRVAVEAATAWRFQPAERAGIPVAARIRVLVEFRPPIEELDEDEDEAPEKTSRAPVPTTDRTPTAAPSPAAGLETPEPLEVLVHGERPVGVKRLGQAEVRQLPGAFGDPFRAIEALPGVTPIASGLPYFFVRGAPPGNVGYFFDGVTVPLLYHVAAGPGVIHPAFISSVDLYSGAYPARYGRFAGGIVAGEAEAPKWEFRGEASVRLVDSGAFLELPFAEGRGSAMLAGRYSYTGLIVSLLVPEASLGYWDYQSRVRYELSPKDSVQLFAFGAHDFLAAENEVGRMQTVLDLTFHRLDARYLRALNASSDLQTTLSFGYDRTGLGGDPDDAGEDPSSLKAHSLGVRVDYQDRKSRDVLLRSGADARFSRFNIDIARDRRGGGDDDDLEGVEFERRVLPVPGFPELVIDPLQALEREREQRTIDERFLSRNDLLAGAWIDAVIDVGSGVTLTPGFRFDLYDTGGDLAFAPEPRIAARFDLNERVSLTHDLGIAHQPPSFAIPIPGLGGAASDGLQRAIQSSAGIEGRLPERLIASVTLFQNVILDSTDIFSISNLQDGDPDANAFIDRTTAHSYGLEFYLRRSLTERLGGFLSYTLSRSTRSVTRLSGISSFDRTHVLNAALAYDLGRRWRLGGRAIVYSGVPAEVAYAEAARKPPRSPLFHRLDWRLEKRWLIGTEGAWWALVMEVLNTTLNLEVLESECYAYGCRERAVGPVTIPSIGVEASF